MEAQVKQRITGAVVLVVLIVIFVPALLTGPRHPAAAATTAAALPGQAALQSYRSDLKAAPTQLATPATETAQATASPQANADDTVAPVTAGETIDQAPAPQVEAAAPAAPSIKTAPKPSARPPAKAPPKAAAPAPRQPSPRTSSPAPATGGWAVQLGGFSSRANAEKLIGDLRRQGFPAFVSDASTAGHPLFRVRAGPAKDRPEAETLLKRLKVAGHSGSVSTNP